MMVVAVIDGLSRRRPPIVTCAAALNPLPVIVTGVPPMLVPKLGVIAVMTGGTSRKVKPRSIELRCPRLFVTTTSTAPYACAGVVTVRVVAVLPVTVPAVPPNVT